MVGTKGANPPHRPAIQLAMPIMLSDIHMRPCSNPLRAAMANLSNLQQRACALLTELVYLTTGVHGPY